MSTESYPVEADALPVRHTDEALLALRVATIRDDVLPAISGSDAFGSFSPWQQDTVLKLQSDLGADQTVDLPTRTGKSYLLRRIAAECQRQGVRAAIIAPRRHILDDHADGLDGMQTPNKEARLGADDENDMAAVLLASNQSIAINRSKDPAETDAVDVVFVDEVHKTLGEATVEGVRNLFPNAVRIAFTATPDYGVDRSVTSEYGEKVISHSIVEAIDQGLVPPVRAFLYKTEAKIDNLNPMHPEFTPRELRKLARFNARNKAIVDMAHDLVSQGRQGLITTIPGEDLLHADILERALSQRSIPTQDGGTRMIRAQVVRGGDANLQDMLDDFEFGYLDVLLYCDLLREGFSTKAASFLLNGRPRTSVVSLTQDIGRVLEPKEGEMILVDYLDDSVKRQSTVYEVLELDRATQAVVLKPESDDTEEKNKSAARDTYMRGLFRPDIVRRLQEHENKLITELHYNAGVLSPYEARQQTFRESRATELAKQAKIWERVLRKAGLPAELPDDCFMVPSTSRRKAPVNPEHPEHGYVIEILDTDKAWRWKNDSNVLAWVGIEHDPIIVPPVPVPNEWVDVLHPQPRVGAEDLSPQDSVQDLYSALAQLTDREQRIIRLRYGLGDTQTAGMKSYGEVGEAQGVSRERIRQIEARALAKLRAPLRGMLVEAEGQEPSRAQIRAYRSQVLAGINPDRGKRGRDTDIMRNRQLMVVRNTYYDALSAAFYDVTGPSQSVHHAHSFIDTVARELGNYGPNDYVTHHQILRVLRSKFSSEELREAIQALNAPLQYIYHHSAEERKLRLQRAREAARLQKAKLVAAVHSVR